MDAPLKTLKILDFSTLFPGPYATQLLADMGADVLRVEAPDRPDMLRMLPPMVDGESAAHLTINRNKRSIGLNLKSEAGQAVVYQLMEEYDILVEGFRPGVMEKLGLGYARLAEINPRLIYCSITGYGQTGPLKDRAGHDINYLALSGLASYSGTPETGPTLSGLQVADAAGGSHHAVMGILAAVIERQQTGNGRHLDIAMSDCALALNCIFGANFMASCKSPELGAELLNGGSFYGYYRTGDDRYLAVGSLEPQFAQSFFQAIDHPEWLPRGADFEPAAVKKLREDLAEVIATRKLEHWQTVFSAIDSCVEPVLDLSEVRRHPHFTERGMFTACQAPDGTEIEQIATPLRFQDEKITPQVGARLGQHTQEVLQSLGYDENAIADLRSGRVID